MPFGQSKNPPAITPVVFRNPRRDFAKSFIAFSLPSLPRCSTERAMQLLRSELQLPSAWKRKLSDSRLRLQPCDSWRAYSRAGRPPKVIVARSPAVEARSNRAEKRCARRTLPANVTECRNISRREVSFCKKLKFRGGKRGPHFLNRSDSGGGAFRWIVGLGKNCG
jgi:hypothetical protein